LRARNFGEGVRNLWSSTKQPNKQPRFKSHPGKLGTGEKAGQSPVRMSDEEDAVGPKKDFMYKIKALKRRTVHSIHKAAGKAEQTKDPEFDDLFERFEEVDVKMSRLFKSVKKYAEAQKALAQASSEMAHAFLDLYDKDPMLKKLAVDLEDINEFMITSVSPQLLERFNLQVEEPLKAITDRVKETKEDAERRKRYMADYDHYRSKKMSLEKEGSKEKNAEKMRENEKKLAEASGKYFAMNERLRARLKITDNNKAAMLNEPLLAAISVEHEFFVQGTTGMQKLYDASKEPKYVQATLAEAEELARLDSQVCIQYFTRTYASAHMYLLNMRVCPSSCMPVRTSPTYAYVYKHVMNA
jgi:hypothetical protein